MAKSTRIGRWSDHDRCRSFTRIDAFLPIAATIASIPYLCFVHEPMYELWLDSRPAWLKLLKLEYMEVGLTYLTPFCISWTIAWVVVRIKPPRPTRRDLGRQPGLIACLAATSAMALTTPFHLALGRFAEEIPSWNRPLAVAQNNGFAVLGARAVFGFGGLFRRERGWIDTAGTMLGGYWVLSMFIRQAGYYIRSYYFER